MKFALFASLVAAATAFAPGPSNVRTPTVTKESVADLKTIAEKANPVIKFYDPMNLSEADFWDQGSEATIGWLRQAEIKHGR